MKSEFALAFNQICSEYRLSREVVLDAIRAALVTAYRRDWNPPQGQNITADINLDTGVARIYVSKEVVETVEDPNQQISLEEARRVNPRVRLGEIMMLDVTPSDFGRIAAQTAKQVITQRLREAERESQHTRLSRQVGEIIIGTVQSVTAQAVILHLDRNEEAQLPRAEQIPGERYLIHHKIRVFVLEVRRTGRGPEIIVSRSHPNMLKRLLELEVPEIRNGSVEIRNVVREAGSRAKVAVSSRVPGLDPVGACIGPRGVRIQNLSRELNGERVDVIEWSEDPVRYITNALSVPAVFSVVLDEAHPSGRTASIVVLDEHLSLAIGKNGQNARLAAKLTGWRVDIQGLQEAITWAIERVTEDPALLPAKISLERVREIMHDHQQNPSPYTDEEKHILKAFLEAVRGAWNRREHGAPRPAERKEAQAEAKPRPRQALDARARVPAEAYQRSIETLDVSSKTRGHLLRHSMRTIGDVMERLAQGDEALLALDGFGSRVLSEIKTALAASGFKLLDEGVTPPAAPVVEATPRVATISEPAPSSVVETPAPAQAVVEAPAEVAEAAPEDVAQAPEVAAEEPAPAIEEVPADLETLFDKRRFELPVDVVEEEEEEPVRDRGKKSPKGKGKRKARPIFYDEDEGKYVVRRPGKADWDEDYLD